MYISYLHPSQIVNYLYLYYLLYLRIYIIILINSSNTYIRYQLSLVSSAYYYINASIHETITTRIVENPIRSESLSYLVIASTSSLGQSFYQAYRYHLAYSIRLPSPTVQIINVLNSQYQTTQSYVSTINIFSTLYTQLPCSESFTYNSVIRYRLKLVKEIGIKLYTRILGRDSK